MEIIFTKGSGKVDLMEVIRPGNSPQSVECPKQRIIPHDMVHYAVEHTLKVQGFLGRVKEGEPVALGMKPEALSDSVERLVEVFQGSEWSGGNSNASDIMEMYLVTCYARQCQPLPIGVASIEGVRAAIAELTRRWEAIPVGGSLQLTL